LAIRLVSASTLQCAQYLGDSCSLRSRFNSGFDDGKVADRRVQHPTCRREFVRNGLLDPDARPQRLRRFIPEKLPSGRPILIFQFAPWLFQQRNGFNLSGVDVPGRCTGHQPTGWVYAAPR